MRKPRPYGSCLLSTITALVCACVFIRLGGHAPRRRLSNWSQRLKIARESTHKRPQNRREEWRALVSDAAAGTPRVRPPLSSKKFDSTMLVHEKEGGKNLDHYERIVKYWSSAKCASCNAATLEALGVAPRRGACALDLGCGDGRYAMWLHDSFAALVDGIDLSPNRVALAVDARERRGLPAAKLDFRVGDLHVWLAGRHGRPWRADGGCGGGGGGASGGAPQLALGYDLIAFFDVLEHLVDPVTVLRIAVRQLAPGGAIVGALPIGKPGGTHLQVYRNQTDVERKLSPAFCVRDHDGRLSGPPADGMVVLCRWDPAPSFASPDIG